MVSSAFANLLGQAQAVELLQRAIGCDRIAPAYLFVGPHGVGRRLAAHAFARCLLSATQTPLRQELENHPDLLWVEPTYNQQGKLISVSDLMGRGDPLPKSQPQTRLEQIRGLSRFLGRTPLEAPRLLVVLDQAETLGEAAANALLKTLEEPGNATLILIAPTPESLLPTLVSRCQRIPFYTLSEAQVATVLTRTNHAEILSHPQILAMAAGSPGTAILHWQRWQEMPSALLTACQQPLRSPQDCLGLARQVDQDLNLEMQLWLIDYLEQVYWQQLHQPAPMLVLEQAKKYLKGYVQPRLVWEVTLLDLWELRSFQAVS
ncbi:DNA polymerase III subunit delta' [Synechococcales cyanobacterium C]|uniref:DNA polymerase III subunit delta n=1 Tax=Petrachloros mirabilis ULC683 TaxID=2781853 RepID=A0A8K1ZWH8_9CYAN|nr:DNA polymerase III subunit delta' [Petrachloros mirabilis]NCJ05162.1 DNA polymerase III subunit delta' [Petrachloros mirabilis ULC683]